MIKSAAQCNGASIINIATARSHGVRKLAAPYCFQDHAVLGAIK